MLIPYHIYVIHTTNRFRNSCFDSVEPLDEIEAELEDWYEKLRQATPEIIRENGYETDNEVYEYDDQIYELSVKFCAELTPQQFITYIWDCAFCHNENTAGALTIEYGLMPAQCIEEEKSTGDETYDSAYISIIPQSKEFDQILQKLHDNNSGQLEKAQHQFTEQVNNALEQLGEIAIDLGDKEDLPTLEINLPDLNQLELI